LHRKIDYLYAAIKVTPRPWNKPVSQCKINTRLARPMPSICYSGRWFCRHDVFGKIESTTDSVFARNDFAAIGAIRAAHKLGMRVPEDVAIAGFDNIPLAAYTTPPLTTVEQPIIEQGAAAATLLLNRIAGESRGAARNICMNCSLICANRLTRAPLPPTITTMI